MASDNLAKAQNDVTATSGVQEPLGQADTDSLPLSDQERYTSHYNRIYPRLKAGTLDFHALADKTGFKERRVRESLLYRLSSGEVMQLFGQKVGFCYICNKSVFNRKEPLCLTCLQSIDMAIQELYASVSVSEWSGDSQLPDAVALRFEPEKPSPEPERENGSIEIPIAQYNQMCQSLKQYQETYGAIELSSIVLQEVSIQEEAPVEACQALTEEENSSSASLEAFGEPVCNAPPSSFSSSSCVPGSDNAALQKEALDGDSEAESESFEQFLTILNADDKDVPAITRAEMAIEDSEEEGSDDAPLRHYGFQRLNSASN